MASLPPVDPSQIQAPPAPPTGAPPGPPPAPAPAAPPGPDTNVFDILSQLQDDGVDVAQLLSGEPDADLTAEQDVRPGAHLPGTGPQEIRLSADELAALASELCQILDEYDGVMEDHRDREEEIHDAYMQRPDPRHGDATPGSARMVSELTMTVVDQQTARLVSNMLEVQPLATITPVENSEAEEDQASIDMAESAERFLHAYLMREMRAPDFLPLAIHDTVAVGTSVLVPEWRIEERKRYHYTKSSITPETKADKRGGIYAELVPNRHVKVWPPTVRDWQEAELVGHDSWLSVSQWRLRAVQWMKTKERPWGLTDDDLAAIEATAEYASGDERGSKQLENQGVQVDQAALLGKRVQLTQVFGYRSLGKGDRDPKRFLCYLCRPARKVLWIGENPYHCQKFPYFPIRYKMIPGFAWGIGAGMEVMFHQAADTTFVCLEHDSLMSSAYGIVLRNASSMRDTLTDRPFPGQSVVVEDPQNDFIWRQLGSEVPQLQTAKDDNRYRAQTASGIPPVLSGTGDPIQKSGASSGGTVALIEQAGKKSGEIDRRIRTDFTAFLGFCLELVAQYAPNGVYYRFASKDDAETMKLLKFVPPRADLDEVFHISVQAPSASTSREARRQGYLMAWQFLMQHMQMWSPLATQYLQATNPAAVQPLNAKILTFSRFLASKIIQDYDLPGVGDQIPDIPAPQPADQTINSLMQQLQQMNQQMQQLTQQAQAAQAPPQPPPQPGAQPPPGPPAAGSGGGAAPGLAGPPAQSQPPQPQAPPPGMFG